MVSFLFQNMTEDNKISSTTEYTDPVIDNTGCCYDPVKDIKIYSCVLSEDLSNISGYTDDGVKAKYIFQDHKWYYGAEISRLNLITFDRLSADEHKKLCSMGGKKTQEKINQQRSLNDIAKAMLSVELRQSSIDEILGDAKQLIGDDKSAGTVMIAKMIQQAYAGSFKAAEFVRDTAGYKPKNEVDISADVITAEDRSLMDKLEKRLIG